MSNILIVGVGGQGSLLASRILGEFYVGRGLDVKLSEVHGMSQRGGSVVTYVRAAQRVDSPIISAHTADMILSFEALETARYLDYLKPNGTIVTSTQEIDPMPVITGAVKYPKDILQQLSDAGVHVVGVDALDLAVQAGSAKTANVVMIGAASNILGGEESEWLSVLSECVPAKFLEMNQNAFRIGRTVRTAQ